MPSLTVRTQAQLLQAGKTTYSNRIYSNTGILPGISESTTVAAEYEGVAAMVSLGMINQPILADANMADTATGEDLDRLGSNLGLTRGVATGSQGFIVLSTLSSTLISTGRQLKDDSGQLYQVSFGGTFANGDLVPISALSTGAATNLAEGSVLTWTAGPPSGVTDLTQPVASGGLIGGAPSEDDATYRARILGQTQNPKGSGNWSHVKSITEDSYPGITAWVYPCYDGPATEKIVVARPPTATDKNRDVAENILETIITPAVQAGMPGHIASNVTTVTNVPCDVSIGLSLTSGFWSSAETFPKPVSTVCTVTDVTSSTEIEVLSSVAPVNSFSQVAFFNYDDWTLYTSLVIDSDDLGSDTYSITLEKPLVGIAVGDYLMPNSVNLQSYINNILDQFAQFGPGEVGKAIGYRPYGIRYPRPEDVNPTNLGPSILRTIYNAGNEITGVEYLDLTPDEPSLPSDIYEEPEILVPRKISFTNLA